MMMATSKQVTITTTSQSIVSVDDVTQYVSLHAKHNVFLGNEGVTTSNGYLMDNDDKVSLVLSAGEVLFGVTNAGSGLLHVLITAQK
jgi:hypothetical protein